ncbi:cupin-like domain-containing protein [Christiangramia sabulilitoris]|uniref:Cupin-like domain-containing protein n=1 Tax=Christiangramia sabulilitoris TaxID=2583991 RepID=A0A550I0E3_9FLAO|nr:cupin-like domain-containing protein [Christiangramia sabulilitoris]TRO64443.1 cupin-like domain-containing protein [Christiangramia sabulilitoris]
MKLDLQNIPRKRNLSKEDFLKEYFIPKKPVVIEDLTENWPAYKNWNFEYFREKAGDVVVPLYDGKPAKGRQNSHGVAKKLPFSEYIDILQKGPTDLRMFFFNLLQNCPDLVKDFEYPDLGVKFFKKLPVLFVGGEGAKVVMHYDMDLANNFHFNFGGSKKVILYPPGQTGLLYKVPYSIVSMEIIDMDNPDFEKYPALARAKGFETRLQHGDALYIPSHWWHFIKYETPSLSLTLRSLPGSPKAIAEVLNNLLFVRNFDNLMRKLRGQKWIDYKNRLAIKRTHKNAGLD